jgi:Cytochrome c7 and related cytochrome c
MNPRLPLLAALALAAAGCAAKAAKPEPAENPPVTFPHSTHVDADISCNVCHAGIEKATSLEAGKRHIALPAKSEQCEACHSDGVPKLAARQFEPTLTFSHATHVLKAKSCQQCHVELAEQGMAKPPVPPMSACTSCHNHKKDYAEARCQPCHVDLKRYPLKPVADYAHQNGFIKQHGGMARASARTCAACHDQTKCAECHTATTNPLKSDMIWPEKVESDFIHRGDWISRHVIEAAADPASCRRCHGSGFCQSCHEVQNIAPGVTGARNPHPSGWLQKQQHGAAARANIVSCAACHDQGAAAICVTCHRPGGIGGNPHPAGFLSKHSPSDQNKAACRICHP